MLQDLTKRELLKTAVDVIATTFEPSFVAQRRPYTYVRFDVVINKTSYSADGFSKVCWPDQWDESEGIDQASNRAIRHIVRVATKGHRKELIALIEELSVISWAMPPKDITRLIALIEDNTAKEQTNSDGIHSTGIVDVLTMPDVKIEDPSPNQERGGNPLGIE